MKFYNISQAAIIRRPNCGIYGGRSRQETKTAGAKPRRTGTEAKQKAGAERTAAPASAAALRQRSGGGDGGHSSCFTQHKRFNSRTRAGRGKKQEIRKRPRGLRPLGTLRFLFLMIFYNFYNMEQLPLPHAKKRNDSQQRQSAEARRASAATAGMLRRFR